MSFAASNPNSPLSFLNPLPGAANYFTGPDPSQWVRNAFHAMARRIFAGVYPGVDVEYSSTADRSLVPAFRSQSGRESQPNRSGCAGKGGDSRPDNSLWILYWRRENWAKS